MYCGGLNRSCKNLVIESENQASLKGNWCTLHNPIKIPSPLLRQPRLPPRSRLHNLLRAALSDRRTLGCFNAWTSISVRGRGISVEGHNMSPGACVSWWISSGGRPFSGTGSGEASVKCIVRTSLECPNISCSISTMNWLGQRWMPYFVFCRCSNRDSSSRAAEAWSVHGSAWNSAGTREEGDGMARPVRGDCWIASPAIQCCSIRGFFFYVVVIFLLGYGIDTIVVRMQLRISC